jgi:hypothetical protein
VGQSSLPPLPDSAAVGQSSLPPLPDPGRYGLFVSFGPPDPSLRISQPHAALPAVTGAAARDPLRAAVDAVYAAVVTHGEDWPALLAEMASLCREGPARSPGT